VLKLPNGLVLEQVYGRGVYQNSEGIRVELGDLSAGQVRTVVLRVRGKSTESVSARLQYSQPGAALAQEVEASNALAKATEGELPGWRSKEESAVVARFESAAVVDQVRQDYVSGNVEQAQSRLMRQQEILKGQVERGETVLQPDVEEHLKALGCVGSEEGDVAGSAASWGMSY
jgi:hypothetical protein